MAEPGLFKLTGNMDTDWAIQMCHLPIPVQKWPRASQVLVWTLQAKVSKQANSQTENPQILKIDAVTYIHMYEYTYMCIRERERDCYYEQPTITDNNPILIS